MRIMITGVTGTVGTSLLPRLLRDQYEIVCLVRNKENLSAQERLDQIADDNKVITVEGNITQPFCGLSQAAIGTYRGQIDLMMHLAGSIKFDQKHAAETWQANVDGTRNVIELCKRLGIWKIHHVSTAYVAGSGVSVFSEDESAEGRYGRNPYEASKIVAEGLIKNSGFEYTISRPGIIVGDATTGKVFGYDGYFGFFFIIWRMAQKVRQKLSLSTHALVELPLVVRCSATSTINLMPVDWVTITLRNLIARKVSKRTFHIVHPCPPPVSWVIATTLQCLNIPRIKIEHSFDTPRSINKRQQIVDHGLEIFRPYVESEPVFGNNQLRECLGEQYIEPSPITRALIQKWMDFAVENSFGRPFLFRTPGRVSR